MSGCSPEDCRPAVGKEFRVSGFATALALGAATQGAFSPCSIASAEFTRMRMRVAVLASSMVEPAATLAATASRHWVALPAAFTFVAAHRCASVAYTSRAGWPDREAWRRFQGLPHASACVCEPACARCCQLHEAAGPTSRRLSWTPERRLTCWPAPWRRDMECG